jgi:hypothetical protein
MTALFALASTVTATAQLTASASIAGKRSYDGFGDTFPGNAEVVITVPAGSEILLVEMVTASVYCQPPSQCREAAFAMQLETAAGVTSWYGPYLTFPTSSQSGTCSGSMAWTPTSGGAPLRSNDGTIRIQFYETYDDLPNLIDAQWNAGTIRVTYAGVAPTGACCTGVTCTSRTQADCAAAGGTWLGAGSACAGSPCGTGGSFPVLSMGSPTRTIAYTAKSLSITPLQQANAGESYVHPDSSDLNKSIGTSTSLSTSSGAGYATQTSRVRAHEFSGTATVSCESAGSGNGRGDGSGSSVYEAAFTLDIPWVADVDWSLQASGTCQVHAASISLKRGTTTLINGSSTDTGESWSGRVNLAPGNYVLRVAADASATSGTDSPMFRAGTASWDFKIMLPVDDCDANGRADWQDLAANPNLDTDGDGVLDACQCTGDLTDDGLVDGADLGFLLAAWGTKGSSTPGSDLNNDQFVDGIDLGIMLAAWGSCRGQ